MILTTAAFDQFITLAFLDDGVYQLLAPDAPEAAATLQWPSMLKVVEFYDFHDILVEEESLIARGLAAADLAIGANLISAELIGKLLAEHDRVVVC